MLLCKHVDSTLQGGERSKKHSPKYLGVGNAESDLFASHGGLIILVELPSAPRKHDVRREGISSELVAELQKGVGTM